MDEQIRKELDAQAGQVAEWLVDRMRWREWWLESELYMAAERDGIDLYGWSRHPKVRAVLDRRPYFDGWCPDGVGVCRLAEGVERPARPPLFFGLTGVHPLTTEQRRRVIEVCEEPPALTCDVVDTETVAS